MLKTWNTRTPACVLIAFVLGLLCGGLLPRYEPHQDAWRRLAQQMEVVESARRAHDAKPTFETTWRLLRVLRNVQIYRREYVDAAGQHPSFPPIDREELQQLLNQLEELARTDEERECSRGFRSYLAAAPE